MEGGSAELMVFAIRQGARVGQPENGKTAIANGPRIECDLEKVYKKIITKKPFRKKLRRRLHLDWEVSFSWVGLGGLCEGLLIFRSTP